MFFTNVDLGYIADMFEHINPL